MDFIFAFACGFLVASIGIFVFARWFKPKTRYNGTLQVIQLKDKTRYSLDLNDDLEVLKNAKEVVFKVNNKSFPGHRS